MWVRYRHTFAYGKDKKWSFVEIDDNWDCDEGGYGPKGWTYSTEYDKEKDLGYYLDSECGLSEQYNWSDKYRGFDYEPIDHPSVEYIIERLNRHKRNVVYNKEQAERFQKMLDELGHITKDDFNVEL